MAIVGVNEQRNARKINSHEQLLSESPETESTGQLEAHLWPFIKVCVVPELEQSYSSSSERGSPVSVGECQYVAITLLFIMLMLLKYLLKF